MEYGFGHENLDVYCLAVKVARWAARQSIPSARRHLRDQLVRAADSVVLNIAEGCGQEPGAARRNHFRIAMGSASETCAVLDLVNLPQASERQQELRRIGAMLSRMSRRG
ncbi:MAG: four helix bundle protein [Deltaproteobacteria bacterium]|nr:four helix bundle protein [Deltaproteobacteria bacterium]